MEKHYTVTLPQGGEVTVVVEENFPKKKDILKVHFPDLLAKAKEAVGRWLEVVYEEVKGVCSGDKVN